MLSRSAVPSSDRCVHGPTVSQAGRPASWRIAKSRSWPGRKMSYQPPIELTGTVTPATRSVWSIPAHRGSPASQAGVARPSSRSWRIGSKTPPEPNVPRVLWISTWKPRSARGRARPEPSSPRLPYGLRSRAVGSDAVLARGAHRSASRTTPSGIGTRRSRRTARSLVSGGPSRRTRSMRWLLKVTGALPPGRPPRRPGPTRRGGRTATASGAGRGGIPSGRDQRRFLLGAYLRQSLGGQAAQAGEVEEAVRHADVLGEPDRHPGGPEGSGIADPAVAQRIVLADLDQGRGQLAVVLGEHGGQPDIARIGVGQVVLTVGVHLQRGQERRVRGGRRFHRHVGGRVDQHLVADGGAAAVTGQQADYGREVAAGALPHDAQRTVRPERSGVLRGPQHGRVAVVDGGREPVARREAVVHRHHDRVDVPGDLAAEPVTHAQLAEDEAAAVEVDDQRTGP